MELLRILLMPFRTASLLFVAVSSALLGFVLGSGFLILKVLGIFAVLITVVWLMRYAFRLIEDAANGVREPAVADIDMLNLVGDPRAVVHPALTVVLLGMHCTRPDWPVAPTLIGAALLSPPSIAASVMSGRVRDALNPLAIAAVVRDLGIMYPVMVLAVAACAGLGALLTGSLNTGWLLFVALELLLLLACACVGGAVYLRRFELGFVARVSPERRDEVAAQQRDRRRQQMLDHLYESLNAHKGDRALAEAQQWIDAATPLQLHEDVREIIAAGRTWNQPRAFARLLGGLLPALMEQHQPAMALRVTEAALAADAQFAPADEPTTMALVTYAMQTGRRREAGRLVENFARALPAGGELGEKLTALRATLQAFSP